MKTSVEKLQGIRVKLTVTLSAEEVDRAIASAYAKVAAKVRIPGFRPGKAPRPIIDTHVGRDTVLAEAFTRRIVERSRKPTSCPLVFAWDGERFRFVTDFLGGGEMGYWLAPGEHGVQRLRNRPDRRRRIARELRVHVEPHGAYPRLNDLG